MASSGSDNFKVTEHLAATEFVPSWLKKAPAPAAPAKAAPAPAAAAAAPTSVVPAPTAATSAAQPPQNAPRAPPQQQSVRRDPAASAAPAAIPWKTPAPSSPKQAPAAPSAPSTTAPAPSAAKQSTAPASAPASASASASAAAKGLSASATAYVPLGPSLTTSTDNRPRAPNGQWGRPPATGTSAAAAAAHAPAAAAGGGGGGGGGGGHHGMTAVTYKVAKSDEEVLEISRASNLKAMLNAAVFIPGQRRGGAAGGAAGPGGSKISPLMLPQSANTEMLLGDCWCLYYLDAVAAADNDFDPTLVFRIDSVPNFWATMNNIDEPTRLCMQSTLYLFRDDINPRWEDPKNSMGGMWRLKVPEDRIDNVWRNLCCRTVGESWQPLHRNTINGIVLKVRERGFWVEIWVTTRMEQFPTDILSAIEQYFPSFNIDYLQHDEMQRKKQEALAIAAASPKAGKKKSKWK